MAVGFDIGNFFLDKDKLQEGAHAFYAPIFDTLGIKVGKPDNENETPCHQRMHNEFVILKYIESTGLAPTVYGHGMVRYVHPFEKKRMVAPYILMQHIPGPSPFELLDLMINVDYPNAQEFKAAASYEARQSWAYWHSNFDAHRVQHETIIEALQREYELEMCDHRENFTNFIINEGLWKVIDFSLESIPAKFEKEMIQAAQPYLNLEVPPLVFHKLLIKKGFTIRSKFLIK